MLGAPREIFDGEGQCIWQADHTLWGRTTILHEKERKQTCGYTRRETQADRSLPPIKCLLRFQNQWEDEETGLYYNLQRYYDPDTGQYLSQDPVGLQGGLRTYGYVHDPVHWVDPWGLAGCPKGTSATKGLATKADEAVFWSGIRNGDAAAARWAAQNGGSTLETTLAARGIKLPVWDASNPASVAAWREASNEFAAGASGNVRVLQTDAVRIKSVWAEVEFPALKVNSNVTSITAVNPETGVETLLWSR